MAEETAAKKLVESKSVVLHVTSPDSTTTVTRDDTGEAVCTAPCDQKLPENVRFRIVSGRPSLAFQLADGTNGHADLQVKPASNTKLWLGVGAAGIGTGLIAGGTATLLYAVAHRAPVPGSDGVDTNNTYTDRMSLGAGLLLAGVIAGIIGTATIISNVRTKVRGDIRSAMTSSPLFTGSF